MSDRTSTKKYLGICLLVAVLVVLGTAVFNYKANRWGIYADDYQTFHGRIRPNRHWMKTDYLISEKHDYDCILFGSSRVGSIDARKLSGNCYNFTHSGGLPSNHLTAFKTFLKNGLPLTRVYLGLDDISYQWNPADGESQHLRRGYPSSIADWLDAQFFYLLQPIESRNLGLVLGGVPRFKLPHHVVDPVLDWRRIDEESRVFYTQPEQQDATFKMLRSTLGGGVYYGESAAVAVEEFIALAKTKGIEVVVFFNPLHYKTYLTRDYRSYLDFKRRISRITDFYDFTGLNHYTTDNRYWKETSHYTSIVGNRLAQVLVTSQSRAAGFGRLVTAENLAALERKQLQTDVGYLDGLIEKEVLLGMPERFVEVWRERGRLSAEKLRQPRGELNDMLLNGGKIELSRGNPRSDYRPGVWTRLRKGNLFLLEYSMSSAQRDRIDVNVRQDNTLVGGDWRSYRVYGEVGQNAGYVAGYATRDNPPIRIHLGEGTIQQVWQPLSLYRISPVRNIERNRNPDQP